MNRFFEEANAAYNAKTWNDKLQFIQKVEESLMNDYIYITVDEIQTCFNVLSRFIADDNKNLVQRSMKIVDALCQKYKENQSKLQINNLSQIFKSVFQCIDDTRPNIREQSSQTIKSLINIAGFTIFCQNTAESASTFMIGGKTEIIKLLKQHQYDMNEEEWKLVFNFLIQIYDDKILLVKNKGQDLYKQEMFINQLKLNINKLNPSQKKIFQTLLDRQTSLSPNANTDNIDAANVNKCDDLDFNDDDLNGSNNISIDLNTSAFLRKQRQKELKDSDGFFLLTDVSTFGPFMHRLSIDIRDVFDDELSELLLSQQSMVKVCAVSHLREIFDRSMKNFEYSADIIIRWCLIQFLSWQLNISQAALSLLTDMFDRCISSKTFKLTSKEVRIITPIALWCTTTQSDAFKYLLQQVHQLCNEKYYNESLLMSLSLDHIPVIAYIFEELKQSRSLETIRGQLEELSQVSAISFVKDECKKLLQKLMPLSPRKSKLMIDPVEKLQGYINKIKKNPDEIDNGRDIFGFMLDLLDRKSIDKREIRYLLYLTYAFLSEPLLVCQINMDDFSTLISSLCEFSINCSSEFSNALLSIGFTIASVQANVTLFDAIINFITKYIDTLNEGSFVFQFFRIGCQLIAINQNTIDLQHLKTFAKSVIGRFQLKNDIRSKLCRFLLAETLIIQNQKNDDERLMKSIHENSFFQFRLNNYNTTEPNSNKQNILELDPTEDSSTLSNNNNNEDLFEFLRILRRLTRHETRLDSIRELINFDDRFFGEKIIETMSKLSPLLGKNIEEVRSRSLSTSKRKSSENLTKNSNKWCSKESRPSSRSSMRSSFGYSQDSSSKKRILQSKSSNLMHQSLKKSSKIPNIRKNYNNNW